MDEQAWERFVQEHPDSSFFHQMGWKRVIENVYGFRPHYLAADGSEGILPLFEIRQLTGKKLISLPFCTEAGILYDTEKAREQLIGQAKDIVKKKGLDYLELRQGKDIGTGMANKDYYCHMKLRLDHNPDIVWESMDRKARNAVRKAEKIGLTTDRGLHYLDDFYKVFSENMRDLGTPVDKKYFFEEIIRQFPKQADIIAAKLNQEVIGAVFLLKHKKTIKSEWASSYRKYFGCNASQLMYWRAIQDACKQGFEIFDFGRSVHGEGTYRFKEKFGAEPCPLHYKYFLNKGSIPDIRKTGWKRRLFADVWKKVPLPAANLIGPGIRGLFP